VGSYSSPHKLLLHPLRSLLIQVRELMIK